MAGGCSETLGFGLSDNFHFLGGYSETLGFGLSDNFHWGGILKLSDLDSLTIFILGGYSETLGFGLSDNFHLGGILKLSDLDSLTIFILGGYSVLGLGLSDNFHWGGGILYFRIGVFSLNISTTPAGSCITDSLSHTYVETNKVRHHKGMQ